VFSYSKYNKRCKTLTPYQIKRIFTKPFTDLEPQKPTINVPNNSIDHISPNPCDVGL